ncbi:hypothetical protein [Mycoplasmopsis agassizii]|uniref:Uncharacterized protein n=1 Tax=Mycoplasmopsis agassizii TaxID=33922 RepID=A0ABX4H5V0_9BACT|nr:hypothetical protein [Mycoplasmopsis agassizii]PAF55153.1 hypothetical protein CJF60_00505 [Mycoplasmopsis agassizii]SMC16795.1 hypothetical protein SAMN02745179_00324 [Mycoplasmopsis agassizii]
MNKHTRDINYFGKPRSNRDPYSHISDLFNVDLQLTKYRNFSSFKSDLNTKKYLSKERNFNKFISLLKADKSFLWTRYTLSFILLIVVILTWVIVSTMNWLNGLVTEFPTLSVISVRIFYPIATFVIFYAFSSSPIPFTILRPNYLRQYFNMSGKYKLFDRNSKIYNQMISAKNYTEFLDIEIDDLTFRKIEILLTIFRGLHFSYFSWINYLFRTTLIYLKNSAYTRSKEGVITLYLQSSNYDIEKFLNKYLSIVTTILSIILCLLAVVLMVLHVKTII